MDAFMSRENIRRLLRECCREMLAYIKQRESGHVDRWVPAAELERDLDFDFVGVLKSGVEQAQKSSLFAMFARMLQEQSLLECKSENGGAHYRSTPLPASTVRERNYYLEKALGAGVLDATFYATYYNGCKFGDLFGCPIDPRSVSPEASEHDLHSAIYRATRLHHGQNAYVGAAFFKYPGEMMTFEEAVEKLKRDNPGFCEDVYQLVIHASLRGMR